MAVCRADAFHSCDYGGLVDYAKRTWDADAHRGICIDWLLEHDVVEKFQQSLSPSATAESGIDVSPECQGDGCLTGSDILGSQRLYCGVFFSNRAVYLSGLDGGSSQPFASDWGVDVADVVCALSGDVHWRSFGAE